MAAFPLADDVFGATALNLIALAGTAKPGAIGPVLHARGQPLPNIYGMDSLNATQLGLRDLTNKDLIASTALHRTLAANDVPGAQALVRYHEDEMTRRFGGETTLAAPFDERPERSDPWWKVW